MLVSHGNSSANKHSNPGHKLYTHAWNTLMNRIKHQQHQIAQSIFAELDSFVHATHEQWLSQVKGHVSSFEPENHYRQIPTALVLAGVNTPDHRTMYDQLRLSALKTNGRVAVIHSGSVISSARSLVSAVVSQLISEHVSIDLPSTGQQSKETSMQIAIQKTLTTSVASTYLGLYYWYYSNFDVHPAKLSECKESPNADEQTWTTTRRARRSLSQPPTHESNSIRTTDATQFQRRVTARRFTTQSDSRKTRNFSASRSQSCIADRKTVPAPVDNQTIKSLQTPGPLVVILPQVESIPTTILQEFIELTSIYVCEENKLRPHTLPLILILGLSTSPEVSFESRLSASTLARLRIQQFTVPPPTTFLDSVLMELIDFPGFRLTYAIQTFLIDSVFLCLDFSVENFVRRFKFCMLDYYLRCPHPQLLLDLDRARTYLQSLPNRELAHCVSVLYPSMSSNLTDDSVEHSSSTALAPTSNNRISLVDHVVNRLEAHWRLAYLAPRLLRCLLALIQVVPGNPMGRTIIDLYRRWLKDGLMNSQAFNMTLNLLNGLSRTAFINAVDEATHVLYDCTAGSSHKATSDWPEGIVHDGNACLTELASNMDQWCKDLRSACEDSTLDVYLWGLLMFERINRRINQL